MPLANQLLKFPPFGQHEVILPRWIHTRKLVKLKTLLLNSKVVANLYNQVAETVSKRADEAAKNTPARTRRGGTNADEDVVIPDSTTSPATRPSRSRAANVNSSGSAKENETISSPSSPARRSTRATKGVESNTSSPITQPPSIAERILSPKLTENPTISSPNHQNSTKGTIRTASTPKKTITPKRTIQAKKSRLVKMNLKRMVEPTITTHRTRRAIAEEFITNNIITRKRLSADKVLSPIRNLLKPTLHSSRIATRTGGLSKAGNAKGTGAIQKSIEVVPAATATITTSKERIMPQRTRIPVLRKK